MPGAFYQLRYENNGVHVIRQIDQSKFPDESGDARVPPGNIVPSSPDAEAVQASPSTPRAARDDGSIVDVMVVYTPSARAAVGGASAMNALIDLVVTETNTSYSNSGINHRLRLVHKTEVAYTEQNFNADLDNITGTADGYMDSVHALRNQYGADEVVLIINNSSSCGLAWLMDTVSTNFAPYAFAVVHHDCATGYYSFGHEIGHNMGSRHDRYEDSEDTPALPTAHGFVSVAGRWRTVMGYNSECAASNVNCTRIQYWSNPSVNFGGRAMGIAAGNSNAADNRTALNTTASTVANFRTAVASTSTSFSGTYSTTGLTIHLAQSSSTLSGTFSAGSLSGNLGGFVDTDGRAYVWAWFDSQTSGSAALAGSLSLSGNQGTFSFGGGQASGGRLSEIVLSGMTQSALSGSTTTSNISASTANYAGTYTTTGLSITLAQSSTTLSGAFSAGSLSGNLGGFVDSAGRAYVWAWFDSQTSGSAALAGSLSLSGNEGTFSFGGGQGSSGTISQFVLSGMTRS